MAKVVDIHLGTTNCFTAVIEDGQLLVIANTGGQCTPSSSVAYQKIGDCLVYQIATENGNQRVSMQVQLGLSCQD